MNIFDKNTQIKRYNGKYFSILGDSISTLEGYNPTGFNVFFKDDNCVRSGVYTPRDTWWGKVITALGGKLLVNNAWSGSRVTRLPENDTLFPSGCSDERTFGLHTGTSLPDVIIVYLGTNDWGYGASLYNLENATTPERQCLYFDTAYGIMLGKLRNNYPGTEIWCCTITDTYMSSDNSFVFPYEYCGIHIDVYNNIIRENADRYGCRLIDLHSYNEKYDTIDGAHPNTDGMNKLTELMLRSIADF